MYKPITDTAIYWAQFWISTNFQSFIELKFTFTMYLFTYWKSGHVWGSFGVVFCLVVLGGGIEGF